MSEEEKKAIKDCDTIFNCLEDMMSEESADDYRSSYLLIKNLIEKQQKEIEEKTTIIMAGAEKVKQLEKEYISKNKIREWLDRFDIEEDLQNKYDELLGSEAIYKFLKELLEEK